MRNQPHAVRKLNVGPDGAVWTDIHAVADLSGNVDNRRRMNLRNRARRIQWAVMIRK